jgi:hypothetical protein
MTNGTVAHRQSIVPFVTGLASMTSRLSREKLTFSRARQARIRPATTPERSKMIKLITQKF